MRTRVFMYRLSPFTYWIGGIVGTELHGRAINCSERETNIFDPPQGMTCGQYLQPMLSKAPGKLQNPEATSQCRYCTVQNADQIIGASGIFWSQRFRNFGIVWAFIAFNIFMAVLLYYLFRVKKWNTGSKSKSKSKSKESNKEAAAKEQNGTQNGVQNGSA